MKYSTVKALGLIAALVGSAEAAQITVQNLDTSGNAAPIIDSSGSVIAVGEGTVSIGFFATTADGDIASAFGDAGSFAALVNDFQVFAQGTAAESTDFGSAAAFGLPGFYNYEPAAGISAGSAFDTESIYVFAGNGDTLASSTEAFVYKHSTAFGPDEPLFTATVNLATDMGGMVLAGAPATDIAVPGAGTFNGFQTLEVIPEPSVSLLALCGMMVAFVRRRR